MDTLATTEKQLIADIDRLREEFTQTQDLYREVCILIFFRYGMTPTANKLYQLVRKGSMTAPAEALNKFWEDLREKSRVRIEHPDLPEALKTAAGELTATLWSAAQVQANEALISYRSEAQAAVMEAKAGITAAESERDASIQALEQAQQASSDANKRIDVLNQQLVAVGATNAALESQVQQAKAENAVHQQRLEGARRDFTAELDKLQTSAHIADERFRAAETRALLEIDRERGVAIKLQKELETTRTAASMASERYHSDTTATQDQLGDLRQKIGMLEGKLQAAIGSRDLAVKEFKVAQEQLVDVTTQISVSRAAATNWQHQAEEFKRILTEIRGVPKPTRSSRKPKID